MSSVQEPPNIFNLYLGSEDLCLLFDALENLLQSTDEGTRAFLCESLDTCTFRERSEHLRSRIAAHLN